MENCFFVPHPQPLSNWRGELFCKAVGLLAKQNALFWFSHYATKESSLPRVGEGSGMGHCKKLRMESIKSGDTFTT